MTSNPLLESKPVNDKFWAIVDREDKSYGGQGQQLALEGEVQHGPSHQLYSPLHDGEGARTGDWTAPVAVGKADEARHNHIGQDRLPVIDHGVKQRSPHH